MSAGRGVRLNKFISESGLCSRREADKYIQNGNVFINGRRAQIGDQVLPGDRVRVNGHELEPRGDDDLVFIALNKPPGITSTTEEGVADNIVRFVNHSKRIFPIGRLDKDSQGLIFLTNNGDLVNKILRAGNQHEKEYLVTVDKPLTEKVIRQMSEGIPMLGVITKKCKIVQEGPCVFRITLVQGLNRQIRRMCEYVGYEVLKLERVRIMNIALKGIPLGEWRELNPDELSVLLGMLEHSSSEVKKKKSPDKGKMSQAGSGPATERRDKKPPHSGKTGKPRHGQGAGKAKPGNGRKPAGRQGAKPSGRKSGQRKRR